MVRTTVLKALLFCTFWLLLSTVSVAQESPEGSKISQGWVRFMIDRTATVPFETIQQAIKELLPSEEAPDLFVIMLHGYDMGAAESRRMYDGLSSTLRENLGTLNVAYLGVQWDSGGGNLLNPAGDYFQTLSRSRDLGRGPLRQMLLQLQEQSPETPVAVMAHSMGCEVILAAVVPEFSYDQYGPRSGIFEAERELTLAMAVFAGSDLDYDVWYKGGDSALLWFDRCRLTWATLTDPSTQGDRVLSLRSRIRGKALGTLFPRMTLGQLDRVVPSGRFYLDGQDVPSNHAFDSYFNPARVFRIGQALSSLLLPAPQEPEELAAMREVLQTPDEPTRLLPYLDSPYAGAAFCALWKIERLNCGDARHMTDRTLEKAVLMLANTAQAVWREQAHSECVTMRKAQYPTAQMMIKAGAPPWARPPRYRPQP